MPKLYLSICLLFFLYTSATAQKVADTSVPVFFEKAYLHTDRDTYAQGEDIWFKAYLVNAQNNASIDYSHNLYVELISPTAKIVQRKMLRLEKGLANGDFKLADTLIAGTYRLRAYTNWMRNFGDNFIFEKTIRLVGGLSVKQAAATASTRKKSPGKQVFIVPQVNTDTVPLVRFFPEGGAMVNGVNSVIAVKSEDANGHGVAATGDVIDNANILIAHFTCDSLGFGTFNLAPVAGQHYQSLATIRGQKRRFILPDAKSSGLAITVINGNPLIRLVLSCSEASFSAYQANRYLISIRHGGKLLMTIPVALNGPNTPVVIPNNQLPEGIAAITLTDGMKNPITERLIYIDHPNPAVTVTTDKAIYQTKEQVSVKIKLNTNTQAHLSLAAVDAGVSPVPVENILSYLNLQSEIKGDIEHAARYFDTTNVNRFAQLNLLLLTQGWRDFVWKRLADTTLTYNREVEQGLTITGKVRKVWSKGSLAGINITMHAPKAEGQKLFWATTDTNGRFTIDNPIFYGYQLVNFNSRRSDKIKDDGSAKGYSGGWLQVDSLTNDTLPVSAVKLLRDTANLKRQETLALERLRRSLNLPDSRNLNEVVIKANTSRLTTREAPQVHAITRAEQKDYVSLGEYLAYIIPEAGLTIGVCVYCTPPPFPLGRILIIPGLHPRPIPISGVYADHSEIDYCYVCQEDYIGLKMNDVLKVTINRYRDVYGLGASVSIIMRPGVLKAKDYFDNTTADFNGYAKARVFYTPKFGAIDDKPDPRVNTIHWEPNMVTDDKGEATVSYFNTAINGKVRLIVQGVTETGTPLVATSTYIVK